MTGNAADTDDLVQETFFAPVPRRCLRRPV